MSDSKLHFIHFTTLKISLALRGINSISIFSGQTNGNKHYKIHGQTDEPLNETGLKQAELVGQALKDIEFKVLLFKYHLLHMRYTSMNMMP